MYRLASAAFLFGIAFVPSLCRGDWSDQAFPVKSHDFGTVAVAAKTEFRFPVHNPTDRTMHLQSVRTSCGCTTATIETPYLEPGQTGSILASFNTATHRGEKGATITVVVSKPVYSEVRLKVQGNIRQDLVFHPGSVDFGKQSKGQELTETVQILYAGRSDWNVVDVLSDQPWLSTTVKREGRSGRTTTMLLTVRVDPSAPAGTFQEQLVVVTNDRKHPRIPLLVSGDLESDLVLSPQSIAIGSVKPGEVVEKRLVLRGKKPFTIESIRVQGWEVSFDPVTDAKQAHVIPVRLVATGEATGQLTSRVVVTTGGGLSATASATLTAVVRKD